MVGQPILSIRNLFKTYHSKNRAVHALQNVSLDIHEGEIFGLLGINGAGKSTLSSILATLHPATSGDVFFHDKSIYKNIYEYRSNLGYCPQQPNLDANLTVKQNLEFSGRCYLIPEKIIQQRITILLKELGLEPYAHFDIQELSGGNRQKLLIARALIHEPRIIILDEPTVGLDPDIRRKLWNLILELKKTGITIILTTHYLDEAEYLSDRICVLHKGHIVLTEEVKKLKEIRSEKRLEDIFIELMKEQGE